MQPVISRYGLLKHLRYICSLTRRAESLATPEIECLLYATYWFRSILSELIGAAKESADVNRKRAPSGPVKVVVTNQPHSRRHTGVDLVSGVSALLAWFPASWASKIAPCFIGEEGGAIQAPQEVSFACPHRVFEGLQRDAVDQELQAVKFTDKNAPGLSLALDEEFQAANCFAELIRGYTMGCSGTLHHDGPTTHWTYEGQLGSNCSIPKRTHSRNVEADSHSVPT